MANKRRRLDKRTLVVLGSVMAVEMVICAGLVMSVHNRKAALEQTLAGKETALSNVRTVSAGLPGLEAQYAKMQAQVQFLEKGLPQPEYIPTLLSDVEKTAIASGISIQEFRPKLAPAGVGATTQAPTNGATQEQFDMTVVGDYGHIQKFLQSLTRFRKILALNSIKLQPVAGGTQGSSPELTAALSLTAFALPPAPAMEVAGAPNVSVAQPASASAAAPAAAKVAARMGITTQSAARG
jgi:Tfp pilus assembly protein PilO